MKYYADSGGMARPLGLEALDYPRGLLPIAHPPQLLLKIPQPVSSHQGIAMPPAANVLHSFLSSE
jgi:hypothetical protein